jgi:hypothetical protein
MVIVVMVIAMVMSPGRSHHAPYAAHDATCYAAGHAANDSANRTGRPPSFGCASFTASYNALSPSGERHCKKSDDAGCYY